MSLISQMCFLRHTNSYTEGHRETKLYDTFELLLHMYFVNNLEKNRNLVKQSYSPDSDPNEFSVDKHVK